MSTHLSAESILDKLSELRSKIAVYETVVKHLEHNYLESDSGSAEMTMLRADNAIVSQDHLSVSLEDLNHRIGELRAELQQWGKARLPVGGDDHPDDDDVPALQITKKDKAHATQRRDQDPPARRKAPPSRLRSSDER